MNDVRRGTRAIMDQLKTVLDRPDGDLELARLCELSEAGAQLLATHFERKWIFARSTQKLLENGTPSAEVLVATGRDILDELKRIAEGEE